MSRRKPRGLRLTSKGYAAIGVSPTVFVPLLDLPWYEDKSRLDKLTEASEEAELYEATLPDDEYEAWLAVVRGCRDAD